MLCGESLVSCGKLFLHSRKRPRPRLLHRVDSIWQIFASLVVAKATLGPCRSGAVLRRNPYHAAIEEKPVLSFASFIHEIHRTFRTAEAERHGGQRALPWLLNLVAAAVLVLASPTLRAYAAPMSKNTLVLDLTPRVDPTGVTGVGVSYVLDRAVGSGQSSTLRFDTLEPSLVRKTDQVTRLEVADAAGALVMSAPERMQIGNRTWQVWEPSRPIKGRLHVSYFVPVAQRLPLKRGPHHDLQAAGGGVSGAFVSLLLLPDLQGPVELKLRWHLPRGQQAVSTLSVGDAQLSTDMDHLEQASFLAGPLQTYPTPARAEGFSMFALGESRDALIKAAVWSEKAYEAERRAFLASSKTPFRFMIRSYDGGPIASGSANVGSFLLYLPPSIPPDSQQIRHLIAHEMVHAFAGGLTNTADSQGDWYTEGLADYMSTVLPFRAHLYSLQQYQDEVNARAAQYFTNAHRAVSLKDAAAIKWTGNGAWMLPYARGALYFANLDAQLKSRGAQVDVLHLINAMSARIEKGAPATDHTWLDLLKHEAGIWAIDDWTAMRDGKLLQPVSGAFGECLQAESIQTGLYDLGFSWRDTEQGSFVGDVEPGSHAEAAGLRPGDEVMTAVDLIAQQSSFDKPVKLDIGRNGKRFQIAYDPHSDTKVDAFRWTPRDGATKADCR